MSLTKYVSAEWVEPFFEGESRIIKAIGDDGKEYFIPSADTDVPPWPQFMAEDGQIREPEPPPEAA